MVITQKSHGMIFDMDILVDGASAGDVGSHCLVPAADRLCMGRFSLCRKRWYHRASVGGIMVDLQFFGCPNGANIGSECWVGNASRQSR